jgi:hypothetical protein
MELSIADNGSRQATPVSVSIVGKKKKKRVRKVRRQEPGGTGAKRSLNEYSTISAEDVLRKRRGILASI